LIVKLHVPVFAIVTIFSSPLLKEILFFVINLKIRVHSATTTSFPVPVSTCWKTPSVLFERIYIDAVVVPVLVGLYVTSKLFDSPAGISPDQDSKVKKFLFDGCK